MKSVIDASAVLALILKEPGGAKVIQFLGPSIMSTVNTAEVMSRLAYLGTPSQDAESLVSHLRITGIPFTEQHAVTVAQLRPSTPVAGLSLGGRACIALALEQDLPVVTADRAWPDLDLGVEVVAIR